MSIAVKRKDPRGRKPARGSSALMAEESAPSARSSRRRRAVNYAKLHNGSRKRKRKGGRRSEVSQPNPNENGGDGSNLGPAEVKNDTISGAKRKEPGTERPLEDEELGGKPVDDPTPSPDVRGSRGRRSRKRIDYARVHNGNDAFEVPHTESHDQAFAGPADLRYSQQLPPRWKRHKLANKSGVEGESTDSSKASSPAFWGLPAPSMPLAPPGKINVFISRPFVMMPKGADKVIGATRLQRLCVECPECRLLLAPVKTKLMRGWCCANCTKFWSTNEDWGFDGIVTASTPNPTPTLCGKPGGHVSRPRSGSLGAAV